jgi:hypothetical protein
MRKPFNIVEYIPGLIVSLVIIGIFEGFNTGWFARLAEGALPQAGAVIRTVDVRLTTDTLGDLKSKLSPSVKMMDCYDERIHYVNCKQTYWAGFGRVRFVAREGVLSAYDPPDDAHIYSAEIDTAFAGTLCGDNIYTVITHKEACGKPIITMDRRVIW